MNRSVRHIPCILSMAALAWVCACTEATTTEASCADPPAHDADEAVELYLAAWAESDPSERACMVERSLAADVVLIAAAPPLEGRTAVARALDEHMALRIDDGTTRESAGPVEPRHDEARASWVSTDPSGTVLERGEDWLEFGADGRLSRIHIFAGDGVDAPLGDPWLAWQRAWNARDELARADALGQAVTEDVRFTDAVADITGRDALGAEIARQIQAIDAELRFDGRVEVFASAGDEPILVRVPAEIVVAGHALEVVDYVRLTHGRIERLSGFPVRE